MKAALKVARRNGLDWSESELLRRLAKLYLQAWRGRGRKSATARRYNRVREAQKYRRIPWYVDRILYSVLWERAVHSGEAVSRMLDFAIRHYLPCLLESALCNPYSRYPRAQRNFPYWQARYQGRRNKRPDLFITYQCETRENNQTGLTYSQRYEIIPKTGLSPGDILHLMRHAA
ncbi:MAG: hypothetical protein OHK0011_25150 [Turneriella sp.]